MRETLLLLSLILASPFVQAQLYIGSGVDLVIKNGETFHYDGLTLTPSADFTLTNTELNKTELHNISDYATVTSGNYIKRYFRFSNSITNFSGSIRFSYSGADLAGSSPPNNPIAEADLRLNYFNGSNWAASTQLPDVTNDFVQETFASQTLKILTLAASNSALPVTWLSFSAEKKESTVALSWSTASEENAQDFLVQHSTTGSGWKSLGAVKAAGNASSRRDYTFTHYSPMPGYNYYRLIQRDINGKYDYSRVVNVLMEKAEIKLKTFPNPIQDGKLNIILKEPAQIRIFDAGGRQVLTNWLGAGLQHIDVSKLVNGVYFIKANSESITITVNR